MASIQLETPIHAHAGRVWERLAAIGEPHRAFAGVLTDSRLESEDVRVVTFAGGQVVRERIVDVDPARMRIAYAVIGTDLVHHSASMQVFAAGDVSRFVWITDVLPDAAVEWIRPLMVQGIAALTTGVEAPAPESDPAQLG